MSRYVIQFYKKGAMRFISHLDLLRLFKRTFKRTGIKLIYSQGFNPHPKMSFVQPLSLGYSSEKEYLDFETVEQFSCEDIVSRLNTALPKGVGLTDCRQLAPSKRTLAAVVEYGSYTATFRMGGTLSIAELKEKLAAFLALNEIIVEKKQKKTGKLVQQNIRPMILDMTLEEADPKSAGGGEGNNNITLTLLVCAGSNRNLNPEVLLKAFCESCGVPFIPEEAELTRNELYYKKPGSEQLLSIFDCQPSAESEAF